MRINKLGLQTGAVLAALALVATGCRGGDDGGGGGGGEGAIDAPGVTSEPCPDAVNQDNGCIYLGTISDLSAGPFAALGGPITDAQAAFWQRVNEDGGIEGYDIDATEYVRDNLYNPETHSQLYTEIEPDVLALAQTLGSPTTLAILDRMKEQSVIGAPASWTSLWGFEDNILESGSSYCVDAMNAVDYYVEQDDAQSVMAVGFPGDYGGDGAAGAEAAAEANGIEFAEFVETAPGAEAQAGAVSAIVRADPDVVILGVGPTETAVIVGQAAAQGYQGRFVGLAPTWNPALLESPAAEALQGLFTHAGPWGSFGTDTPGHEAMRTALGDVDPNDGYTSGWAWSYPLKAALESWLSGDYDKTREGLVEAVGDLESVDFEGMLPEEAGDRTQDNDIFRQTVLSSVDPEADAGLTVLQDFTEGPSAAGFDFTGACFEG
ncbi:ABC transporter substrate-binding protein [Nocardioides litoris]|uniref:ABC transporter substrate-binding protein n=1 Tax=Nocardioides litoris TaxID=1926648 RepID=UPI001FE87D84|nr:ABC transporter substrate-binding protein [Nocardioides litoris]